MEARTGFISDIDESSIDWEDLYFDLKNERAILVLGPDFYSKDGLSVKELLYKELTKRDDHGIVYFYPSNGIFLFKSQLYKSKAQKLSSQFYKSLEGDNNILQKIIELPFRMIINTNPEKILENKYKEKNMDYQFDYFTWRPNKKMKEISEPDNYYPLIFNLFGSVDSYESIVLDFEDIFDHLKSLLNNINVPDVIRSVLSETDTYIFIGFHLEKWDTQLLFRYLNMKEHCFDDSKKNYTTKSLSIDNSSESFFRQQFNLKYYGAPVDFLDKVHAKYFEMLANEDKEITRELSPKKTVEYFISLDEVQKSLNYLTDYTNNKDGRSSQELIMIKSNFARYMYLTKNKLENVDFLEIQRNKIKQSILDIAINL